MFLKKIIQSSLVLLFLILFGSHESLGAEKRMITWGTTATTSGPFVYYVTTAKILNEKIPEINVTVRATGGGIFNTRFLEKGEVEIGAIDTASAWEAIHSKGAFEGKPSFPDLRLLDVKWNSPHQFVVSEKSGVKDIYGLEGKLFCPGQFGGSTERAGMDILRILGVKPQLRRMSHADALEAMKDERIVGYLQAGAPNSAILDIMSVMKIRILSLGDEEMKKITANVPGFRKVVVPSGMYPGIGEFNTVGNEWSDFVRKDFPAELAYKWVKTIWENRAEIKKSAPVFSGDHVAEISLAVKSVYMHLGAIKFYRELGFTVPKVLVPPEMGEK